MTPEGKVKQAAKKAFNKVGIYYWMPVAGMYGRRGVSDFVAVHRGHVLFVETKATAKDHTTLPQKMFGDRVQKAGAPYWVIHADNVIELPMLLRDFMEEIDRCSESK